IGQGSLFQKTPTFDGNSTVPSLFVIVSTFVRGLGARSHEERAPNPRTKVLTMTNKLGTVEFPSKVGVFWNSEPWPIRNAQNMA
ncbi:hypothetical protein C6A85_16780, partial [Mycobacterium sp. ITM-2017-0098]